MSEAQGQISWSEIYRVRSSEVILYSEQDERTLENIKFVFLKCCTVNSYLRGRG